MARGLVVLLERDRVSWDATSANRKEQDIACVKYIVRGLGRAVEVTCEAANSNAIFSRHPCIYVTGDRYAIP